MNTINQIFLGMVGPWQIMLLALFTLIPLVILIVAQWKIFVKAGQPGWASIVPIYNFIVYLKIINRPLWWIAIFIGLAVLSIIPFIGILASIAMLVVMVILTHDLSKAFGKGAGFTVGLILLGIVFYPILAFGDAQYQGATNNSGTDGVLDAGQAKA